MADRRPNPRQPSSVLRAVKDATRRCRGGLRPSLTAPARAALQGAGRDEGMAVRSNKWMPKGKREVSATISNCVLLTRPQC